jgi:CheY-like chemotaxis protein
MERIDIMMVDDNELVRRGIAQTLRRAGYAIEEYDNPTEALKNIQERKRLNLLPRLIISDYSMPETSGANFVKILRTLYGLKTLPIIMVSAETKPEPRQEANSAGITAWVQKSRILQELMPLVQQHAPLQQ